MSQPIKWNSKQFLICVIKWLNDYLRLMLESSTVEYMKFSTLNIVFKKNENKKCLTDKTDSAEKSGEKKSTKDNKNNRLISFMFTL